MNQEMERIKNSKCNRAHNICVKIQLTRIDKTKTITTKMRMQMCYLSFLFTHCSEILSCLIELIKFENFD